MRRKTLILISLLLLCSCGPVGVIPATTAALTGKSGDKDKPVVTPEQRTWIERFPLTSPSARTGHVMTYDSAREAVVLFGGYYYDGMGVYCDDTWEWDGIDWVQKFPSQRPSARRGHAIVYDSKRSVVVLFGGVNATSHLSDTWEWDGDNWADVSPIGTEGIDFPSVRQTHSMAYDTNREVTVLFGGCYYDGAYTNYDDTWEWDGISWAKKLPVDVPSPRRAHAMTYDSERGVVVLFGGYDDTENLSDTWEWDGVNWAYKFSVDAPSARFWHTMAYNSKRSQTILFGGCYHDGTSLNFNDTWTWDGANWTQEFPEANPPERRNFAMAYDSRRDAVVIFGGYDGNFFGDTWEYEE